MIHKSHRATSSSSLLLELTNENKLAEVQRSARPNRERLQAESQDAEVGEIESELSGLKHAFRSVTDTTAKPFPADDITEDGYLIPGVDPERVLLVGATKKGPGNKTDQLAYGFDESLVELGSLAETAGLHVVSQTYQQFESPHPATYIGTGKLLEIKTIVEEKDISTVIFDDELSPAQLKNIEKTIGNSIRVCDRTALTLDIFSQHARSKEGKLQVELAQYKYQLPRLARMWTHLERQVGGAGGNRAVKGMGEKQIEIDKRILRRRMSAIAKDLEEVKMHRRLKRKSRIEKGWPLVTLVGYTNAGKSTLLNALTEADALVEDKLFATLDPMTRKLKLPSGKTALLTDTVGFIQKLPPQLIAAFSATLEELADAALLLHVVDASSPYAAKQQEAVQRVLKTLGVDHIPLLVVWNKMDQLNSVQRHQLFEECDKNDGIVFLSAGKREGLEELLSTVERSLEESMIPLAVCIPYRLGELVQQIHMYGVVKNVEYNEDGTYVDASVPLSLASRLKPFQVDNPTPLSSNKIPVDY